VKWEGWRALVYVDDGIQIRTRTGRNVTSALPEFLDGLGLAGPAWITSRWYPGDGEALFEACVEQGHEGMVAKRLDGRYLAGRAIAELAEGEVPGVASCPRSAQTPGLASKSWES
jgi:ATP-dependent DNA ligase